MSAATVEPTTTPPATTTAITSQPAPADATGTNGGTQGSDKTFTQIELDAIVKDRLERAKRKQDEADAKAKGDAELKALEDGQKDKERADKLAERLVAAEAKYADMETLQQERDRLANVVDGLVKQQREGLPEYVIDLLDGRDAVDQLAWITKNRETLAGVNGRPSVGINAAPRPAGPANRDQLIAQEVEAQRSRRR